MKVILTGANGFLGKEINKYFSKYTIIKLGRRDGDIIADLENEIPIMLPCDLIIHAAGKAHITPRTQQESISFNRVNVIGTANLIKGLEKLSVLPKYFVFISSVSVYGKEEGILVEETHPLNAKDPYGKSKIEAERIVEKWCQKNNIVCTILRLPLLAGKNPPGNLKLMIAALHKGYYFNVGSGSARKSMVMISDVAVFIESAFQVGGTYNLTDRRHPSFKELSLAISKQINRKYMPLSLPYSLVKFFSILGNYLGSKAPINSNKLSKMTKSLTFSDQKARNVIGWEPQSVIESFII